MGPNPASPRKYPGGHPPRSFLKIADAYLRSSGDGTYPLKATLTWKIHWTGTGVPGGDLPDGTFGATQNVVVQEIQAVNR
ncbi:hypothetical protein ACYF6T_43585 [Streptomyces sp. 7R007]